VALAGSSSTQELVEALLHFLEALGQQLDSEALHRQLQAEHRNSCSIVSQTAFCLQISPTRSPRSSGTRTVTAACEGSRSFLPLCQQALHQIRRQLPNDYECNGLDLKYNWPGGLDEKQISKDKVEI
jgi:hypothetical protein